MNRNMKKIFYIGIACATLLAAAGCQKEAGLRSRGELSFAPVVKDLQTVTRADGNDFFEPGFGIDVNITTTAKEKDTYSYVYNSNGTFQGNPPFRFTMDDDYITTLEAVWPAGYDEAAPFITDQREFENFRQADRLKATGVLSGVMPTEAPVPLYFERQNTMLEFELAGQNSVGLVIKSLLIELQAPSGTPTAYWAYCGTEDGHAQLILPPDTKISAAEGYLIGTLTVVPDDHYTIIFPKTEVTLEAGKRYMVTLTPQGYPMNIYAFIGGWNQGEDGIGIPFQEPTPNVDGSFLIDTPQRLITMSYLMRNYADGATFDWATRTYVISDGLAAQLNTDWASKYVALSRTEFPDVKITDAAGDDVTTIQYDGSQTLKLFE